MRRALLLGMGLFVLPSVSEAQVELGLDAGLLYDRAGGESVTAFAIPVPTFRIGFPVGSASIESLVLLQIVNQADVTSTRIVLLPGVNFPVGSSGMYLRAELGLTYVSGGGFSASQFGFGGAVGYKRPMGDGPVSLRFEGGVDQFLENDDFLSTTSIRALIGFSVVVE